MNKADVFEIECCPFCKDDKDIELRPDEQIVICNNCGKNFVVIEGAL